ncbi:MAG TPA: hypothetical protein VFS35_05570, partial [Terrimicrobiaceae bacterium]|nr:hypothetical protein [Terrimicrobiaceae bacterium]
MKLIKGILVVVGLTSLLLTKPVLAGDGKTLTEKVVVEQEEARKWWGASLSTGWDSLYMFRGVNVLRFDQDGNEQKYGSSLYWTQLNVSFMPTENDTITLGTWFAFGLTKTNYKELDVTVNYVHTFGDLAVGMGYTFYYYLASVLYQNELNWTVAYTFHLPAGITLVPSVIYYLNLGPEFDNFERGTGAVETASSFLVARLDAGIPIYKDIISLAPWFAFGTSFDFNAQTADNSRGFNFYTGANNIEVGIGLPIKINDMITVYGYGAYSYQWQSLVGTEPSTF